jgi:hypothetical protein
MEAHAPMAGYAPRRRGQLVIDISAAKEAINRQKSALDAVRFDRAVRGDLRQLLVHPEKCWIPEDMAEIDFFQPDLDDAKRLAVKKALSTEDFLLVQGPPGTGKTTFITELILQTLKQQPSARILLTSQTHVALDNAVERLQKQNVTFRIVRIGPVENDRISKRVEKLLIEKQLDAWRNDVIAQGKKYLESWAAQDGIAHDQFQVGTLLRRLGLNKAEIEANEVSSKKFTEELEELKKTSPPTDNNGDEYDEIKQVEEDLAKLRSEADARKKDSRQIVDELKKLEPDAAELIDSTPEELNSWAEAYHPDNPTSHRFEKLISTHTDWESRLGRAADFESALVCSSQVVAGTCIRMFSLTIRRVAVPHRRRRRISGRPIIPHIRPQPPRLCFSSARRQHRYRRVITMYLVSCHHLTPQRFDQRRQQLETLTTYTASCGVCVRTGRRQSIPSSNIESCAGVTMSI